jgi:hypothetical protein
MRSLADFPDLNATGKWFATKKKILMLGQVSHGWWNNCSAIHHTDLKSIDAIMVH